MPGSSSSADTIFALSSGNPPAGIAVIRMSGRGTAQALRQMTGSLPVPRQAVLATIRTAEGTAIDHGLVLHFPGPASFTGEDCAELHLHGSRAVVRAALAALADRPGFRLAEPGEFTRRALAHGKLDLIEAEALADLIASETEAQRSVAVANSRGGHTSLYASWRARIVGVQAALEAAIDFSDEGDVPAEVASGAAAAMREIASELGRHVAGYRHSELVREGFRVVVAGPPNAGKSSLINVLARRDVAIVAPEPGTTRDLVEIALDIGGMKVVVTDTAGLREGAGSVEAEGIRRARRAMEDAHLVLWLGEVGIAETDTPPNPAVRVIRVGTKTDLHPDVRTSGWDIAISARTGAGLERLIDVVKEQFAAMMDAPMPTAPFNERHVFEINRAIDALHRATVPGMVDAELLAEELRLAARALGRLIGDIDVEQILDVVFARFCIGK